MQNRERIIWPFLFASLVMVIGCREHTSVPETDDVQSKVAIVDDRTPLVTINSKPIYQEDVQFWLHKNTRGHLTEGTPEQIRNVLEALIDQELILQRAHTLGLDQSQLYQQKIRIKQAELDALRRTEIRKIYYRHQAEQASEVDSAEIEAYFNRHESEIKTQYHVLQIRKRSEKEINEVKHRLSQGAAFEQIAAEPYQSMPKSAGAPWDLGFLRWTQMPEPWRKAIANLDVGAISGVLKGSGRLFWIVKLVDKRTDRDVAYATIRPMIEKAIEATRVERLRDNTAKQLRKKAEIIYASSMQTSSDQSGRHQ